MCLGYTLCIMGARKHHPNGCTASSAAGKDKRSDITLPDGLIKGGTEELAAVLAEADTCYSFAVGTLEPPQTLTALDLPNLNRHIQFVLNLCFSKTENTRVKATEVFSFLRAFMCNN